MVKESIGMAYRKSQLYTLLLLTCSAVLSWATSGTGTDMESGLIKVHGDLIDMKVDHMPLTEVLQAISRQTGIDISADMQLHELVTAQENDAPLERAIRRILHRNDYILVYCSDREGQLRLSGVKISNDIPGRLDPGIHAFSGSDHTIRTQKQVYAAWVKDTEKLNESLTVNAKDPAVEERGLSIAAVAQNSYFKMIGLEAGDYIQDVNGQVVTTKPELIQALQAGTGINPPVVRIARLRGNLKLEPIYIELE